MFEFSRSCRNGEEGWWGCVGGVQDDVEAQIQRSREVLVSLLERENI